VLMANASSFGKPEERWANELWNLSLLPLPARHPAEFQADDHDVSARSLENLDLVRSCADVFLGALRVKPSRTSDTLSR